MTDGVLDLKHEDEDKDADEDADEHSSTSIDISCRALITWVFNDSSQVDLLG